MTRATAARRRSQNARAYYWRVLTSAGPMLGLEPASGPSGKTGTSPRGWVRKLVHQFCYHPAHTAESIVRCLQSSRIQTRRILIVNRLDVKRSSIDLPQKGRYKPGPTPRRRALVTERTPRLKLTRARTHAAAPRANGTQAAPKSAPVDCA